LTIRATDGDIGTVETIYFDDDQWVVRYFVVDTGGWRLGRRVLISPMSVRQANWPEGTIDVALTRDEVRNSPDVDTERPVSRQHEVQFSGYYGYPYYWAGPGLWGPAAYPGAPGTSYGSPEARAVMDAARAEAEALQAESDSRNSHLRSAKVVKGYHIHATDGEIGHVDDFLIDDESWAIRYLVVDTSNWLGGRSVLVAPSWIRDVSWDESKVFVSTTRHAVESSPEYDPMITVTSPYEERLGSHYRQ